MMKGINIKILHGGLFGTKKQSTMCEGGGINLLTNIAEVAYFEIVDWIKNDCGCQDIGRIFLKD